MENQILAFDIRRSIILSQYIKAWGLPVNRIFMSNADQSLPIEIYEFMPNEHSLFYRLATIGISEQLNQLSFQNYNTKNNWELMFCLPKDLGDANITEVQNYFFDIIAYTLTQSIKIDIGTLIPPSELAPPSWQTTAICFDEARGEPEYLTEFQIGSQQVQLLWLIPLTTNEYNKIYQYGLDELDKIEAELDVALIDVTRK